jgi:rod shape-determining protein MreD
MRKVDVPVSQRALVLGLLLACACLLQVGVASRFSLRGLTPDLVLCFVLLWSLLEGGFESLILAFCAGIALDFLAGNPLGGTALALMGVAGIFGFWPLGVIRTNIVLEAGVIITGSLAYYSLLVLVVDSLRGHVSWVSAMVSVAVPSSLLNLVVAIPILLFLLPLHARLEGRARQIA